MSQTKTPKFIRLPPRTGIPFEGFEFARVRSRLPVARQLEDFLNQCVQSNSVGVALIRAEWGEGKTDAYERYLEPAINKLGDFAYLVSTSTIALHLEKIHDTFPRGGTTAAYFLAATFAALKDELRSRHRDDPRVIDYTEQKDPLDYVHCVLNQHVREGKKLFLFIDEFEEILNHPEIVQRFALSGIKELVNGQLGIVHGGGPFAGRLHLIVAVTPYAWGRMHDDRELLQIFGSFASRLSVVDLPQIDRDEAFTFLMDLVRYSYGGYLPDPLPFRTAGILNGICSISQRNMRPLVQLYVDLMANAVSDNALNVIDANRFINALENKEIAVFGELRPCVDGELFGRVETVLRSNRIRGQQCVALFRLLVGEHKPFSVQEILTRLGLPGEADVHTLVDITNQELAKLGIPRAIMRLNPMRPTTSIAAVLSELAPSGDDILLVESKISLQGFREMLVHKELTDNENFDDRLYLPYDDADLKDLFDIGDADATFIVSKIGRHFEEMARTRHFMISPGLADQVFPSPSWVLIDFVADRRKRTELWREAAKVFPERLWQLRDLVIEVINQSIRVRMQATGKAQAIYETRYTLTGDRSTPIRTYIASTTSMTATDVKEFVAAMSSKAANLGILIHTGDIDDEARSMLNAQPQVITVHIRRVRALQLLVLGLAREKELEIRKPSLEARLRDIFHEIDFERLINQWVARLREEGVIIDELSTQRGRSDRALADALIFSINNLGENLTAQELFDRITQLRSFTFYRQNTRFAPIDIETVEDLETYLDDLVANGLLEKERNKFSVKQSRVEDRIARVLRTRPLSLEALKSRFVIFSSNQAILEQVYLPLLEHKGLIVIDDEISLQESSTAFKVTKEAFQRYDQRITRLRDTKWWSYAYLSVSKEREDRVIGIEEFDAYVRKLYQLLSAEETAGSESLLLQRSHLVFALLTHFELALEERVNAALSRGEQLIRTTQEKVDDLERKVSPIVDEYNHYCEGHNYSIEDIEEITALRELRNQIAFLDKTTLSKDTIAAEIGMLRRRLGRGDRPHFFFSNDIEKADYFNLKVKKLREQLEMLDGKAQDASNACDYIAGRIDEIIGVKTKTRGRLTTFRIDSTYAIASVFFAKLTQYHETPLKAELTTGLTLGMLRQFFDRVHSTLSEYGGKVNEGLNLLDDILDFEKSIVSRLRTLETKMQVLDSFFDKDDSTTKIERELAKSILDARTAYESTVTISKADINAVRTIDELVGLRRKMTKILTDIQNRLVPLETGIERLRQECMNSLDTFYGSATRLISVLAGGGVQVAHLRKTLDEVMSSAKSGIRHLFAGEGITYPWSKLWEELDTIRDRLYVESEKILTKQEFKVLYSVVSTAERGAWLLTEELVNNLCEELKLELTEVAEALRSLVHKGFLREGVTLAV